MPLEHYLELAILGVIAVAWYLLRQKDARQQRDMEAMQAYTEKQLTLLFVKHDEDVKRLADLELRIAQNHYAKTELDNRFEKLELSFREGFREIGGKFDRLSELLLANNKNHPNGLQ